MRIRRSRPLGNAPETARSISFGRLRPVAVNGAIVAELRGSFRRLAKCGLESAPGRTRTCDPRLRRPVLYPTELRARATADSAIVLRRRAYRKISTSIRSSTAESTRE